MSVSFKLANCRHDCTSPPWASLPNEKTISKEAWRESFLYSQHIHACVPRDRRSISDLCRSVIQIYLQNCSAGIDTQIQEPLETRKKLLPCEIDTSPIERIIPYFSTYVCVYVRIRQDTSAYVSIWHYTPDREAHPVLFHLCVFTSVFVRKRQHTSA